MPQPEAQSLAGSPPMLELTWDQVSDFIASSEDYYLCTAGPSGAPHAVPVLGLWIDDRLYFNSGTTARKARHLYANPDVAVVVAGADHDVTIEGTASVVTDTSLLRKIATAFTTCYPWWHPVVVDGRFYSVQNADPRDVFEVTPRDVFGFGKGDGFSGTRWSLVPN